jgi:hypothetical protein
MTRIVQVAAATESGGVQLGVELRFVDEECLEHDDLNRRSSDSSPMSARTVSAPRIRSSIAGDWSTAVTV